MQIKGVNAGDYLGSNQFRAKKQDTKDGVFRENLFQNPTTDEEEKKEPARMRRMAESAGGMIPEYRMPRVNDATGMLVTRIPETWQSKKVPPEGLPYHRADRIKLDILEGYVLKGRKKEASEGNAASVYIEVKRDDGCTEGYIIRKEDIPQENRNEIEQFAYELFQ